VTTYKLKTPISEEEIRKLVIGDTIYISGEIYTARDQAHKRALEYYRKGIKLPVNLENGAIYHCGPLVKKVGGKWEVVSAGPTTSTRMEPIEADFIEIFKVRVVIGKGGMGSKTTEAMKRFGAIYAAFTGGAGALAAKSIKRIKGVEWLDLGMPEAMWILEVEDFGPLTVAIDSHGRNLHENIIKKAQENKSKILDWLGIR